MTETLHLTFLGGLAVAQGQAELQGFVSRKARALLAYLAVTGRSHFRDALAGLLWGQASEERAAGNLRVVLSNLRRLTPDHVVITRQMVAFDRESDYWLDVQAFQECVDEGLSALPAPSCLPNLCEAVELYQGDFLEGFYVRGAPAFEEWVTVERERLRQMILQALHCLVRYHTARGEYATGIEYATRLLALDSWREEAHRELMRLLALSGQRSAALAQYEECRRLLAGELGLEPLEETTALYERLVDWQTGELGPGRSIDGEPGTPGYRVTDLPFVGRGEEHATLVSWWQAAQQSQEGRLALVEGEAGVGKTRLVEEVIRYAEAQGTVVLRGRCYEFGSGVPYQPLAEALRGRTAQLTHLDDVWLAELARLQPELRQTYPNLPDPPRISGEAARQRLFEAVACFFLSTDFPFFVFLDDLHWADSSTLDLLHYLVRRLAGVPVWLVGTYRPEELSLSHPVTRLRQGLSRDHLVDQLSLNPLSPEAIEQIAQSLVGQEAETDLGMFLYRESEGNPFILTETVSDLQEQGALCEEQDERWQWHGPPLVETLPVGVQNVVLQRVGRLNKPARRLLKVAAVVGRQFDAALLQAATGSDMDVVEESLDEWLTRRLARPIPSSRSPTPSFQYDFSHDKIRAVVYHATESTRRRTLHRQVGEALERVHSGQLDKAYEQLAYHYEQAGLTDRALTYLPLAAGKASSVYANQEALAYYDRALVLLGERDERRGEILLQRAKVLRFLSRYDEAIAVCWQVVEEQEGIVRAPLLAIQTANELSVTYRIRRDYDEARSWAQWAYRLVEEADAGQERGRLKAQVKQILGHVEREQGNLETAQEQFEEALARYRALADQRGVAECLNGLGHVFSSWGQYNEARERFDEALVIFRDLGDRQSEATCLRAIGLTHWRQVVYEAAHQAFTQSLQICRAIGDRESEAQCLNDLSLVYFALGDNDEAQHCWQESAALFQALGLEKRAASCLHRLGILHQSDGNYAAAQQCLEESLAVSRATGAKTNEALDLGWLGKLCLMRGEYDEARRCLERALVLGRESGGSEEEPWHLIWMGAVAYEMGNLATAQAHLQEAIQLSREWDAETTTEDALRWLALVHLARGDGMAALAAAHQALAESRKDPLARWTDLSHAMLGTVYGSDLLAGTQDPVPYFERALTSKRRKNPYEYGLILRRYGAYLLYNGEREQGETYLQKALSLFERLGAQGERDKVRRLLAGNKNPRLRW